MINKKSKRAAERAQKSHAAKYFAKIAALNELIDNGEVAAKDAIAAKAKLANQHEWQLKAISKQKDHKTYDVLDSRKILPGSYGSGKRR